MRLFSFPSQASVFFLSNPAEASQKLRRRVEKVAGARDVLEQGDTFLSGDDYNFFSLQHQFAKRMVRATL